VLVVPQEYSLEHQARLVSALVVIHNFICIHDLRDNDYIDEDKGVVAMENTTQKDEGSDVGLGLGLEGNYPAGERGRAAERREQIAHRMWRDYKNSLR
jgi:hypothetical protein